MTLADWTEDRTPCGKVIWCTEMSTWEANGCPDPLTGEPCPNLQLTPITKNEEVAYFVGMTPSGLFVKFWND